MSNKPRLHIISDIDNFDTSEVKEYFDVSIEYTNKRIKTKLNPYFNELWGDFDWIRSLFDGKRYDARCYATSRTKLINAGIKGHLGNYDLTDKDGVADFYIGVPSKLTAKAKKNGFKTEEARLCVHEYLHGAEQNTGTADRVHSMQDQGRLKELWKEHRLTHISQQISVLQKMVQSLVALFEKPKTLHKRLPDPYNKMISQGYGVKNPRYKITGHHLGVDYACPIGTPIYAPWDGEVTVTGKHGTLGNFCYFEYEYGGKKRVERNLHLNYEPKRRKVKRGQVIAHSGNTGMSDGPHYHIDGWWNEVNLGLLTKLNWHLLTYDPHID